MPQAKNALIVVAKQPAPGHTKTRLSPPLTPGQASALYECFLLDTLEQMRKVETVQRVIAHLPADAGAYFTRLAPDFGLVPQYGGDLGERLDHALTGFLSGGYERAVIMDSDSPTLPSGYLAQAFELLEDGADVVIGPCEDGGYYLIGLRQPQPRLLREVRMSTPTVAADTIAIARSEGLRVDILPRWYDVDDGASLLRLANEIESLGSLEAAHTRRLLRQDGIRRALMGEG
jgi:uncharacterized protein